jgi:hypothetical protein
MFSARYNPERRFKNIGMIEKITVERLKFDF